MLSFATFPDRHLGRGHPRYRAGAPAPRRRSTRLVHPHRRACRVRPVRRRRCRVRRCRPRRPLRRRFRIEVGEYILSANTVDSACGLGATSTTTVAPLPTGNLSIQPTGSGDLDQLLPGGLVVLSCQTSNRGVSIAVFDIFHSTLLWSHPLAQSSGSATSVTINDYFLDAGAGNVYLLTITQTPAFGLAGRFGRPHDHCARYPHRRREMDPAARAERHQVD